MSDEDCSLEAWQCQHLRSELEKFEHVFSAELQATAAYVVPKVGIYSTPDLVDQAQNVIVDSLRESVDNWVLAEIQSAGRCLAFRLPTASAYHIGRAVERAFREYCRAILNEETDGWTLGHGISRLKAHLDENEDQPYPRPTTLRSIDDFRELERNPIFHPDVTLDDDEAYRVSQVGTTAIAAMTKETKALQPELPMFPPQETLAQALQNITSIKSE